MRRILRLVSISLFLATGLTFRPAAAEPATAVTTVCRTYEFFYGSWANSSGKNVLGQVWLQGCGYTWNREAFGTSVTLVKRTGGYCCAIPYPFIGWQPGSTAAFFIHHGKAVLYVDENLKTTGSATASPYIVLNGSGGWSCADMYNKITGYPPYFGCHRVA
jgi:hypothetical protein